MKGFRDFILRGNVVDLAVGIVIGAAFTAVVTALVNSFINPLVLLILPQGKVAGKAMVGGVTFDWGAFLAAVINFLIVAAVVYFLVVLPVNKLMARVKRGEVETEEAPASEEAPSAEVQLLTQIRDELRARR